MSPAAVPRMEKAVSIVRQIYGRSPTDDLNDLDDNNAFWSIFMNVTLQAAVHLGRDFLENLRFTKNQLLKSAKQLFQVTEKLIKDQTEISGLTTIDCKEPPWRSTTLLCDKANEITNAKPTYSDSVLCLGSISDQPVEAWKNTIKWYWENRYLKDLDRIDGEPMELEWKIFSGFTTMGILEEIQKCMTELQCAPEQFKGRLIFMSMYNDTVWRDRGNTEKCIMNSVTVANCARRFLLGRWSFSGLGSEKKWCGTCWDKPDGDWDKTAELMMLNFEESGHPIFRATSALERGELRSNAKGKKSIHFNGCKETIELILRTLLSVNQLCIYGAVVAGKSAANEDLESMDIPTELPVSDPSANAELQGNLLQDYDIKFEQLSEDQRLSKLCSDAALKT